MQKIRSGVLTVLVVLTVASVAPAAHAEGASGPKDPPLPIEDFLEALAPATGPIAEFVERTEETVSQVEPDSLLDDVGRVDPETVTAALVQLRDVLEATVNDQVIPFVHSLDDQVADVVEDDLPQVVEELSDVADVASPVIDRAIPICSPLDAEHLTGIGDDAGHTVRLDVLVLLDGISPETGRSLADRAGASYTPLEIALRAEVVEVTLSEPGDAQALLDEARTLVSGQRPDGFDVVHVLTEKDLRLGPTQNVIGLASCIGGVADPEQAFSISEADRLRGSRTHLDAITMAHEIGHLMGGTHERSNCVEGPIHASRPCTVMSPFGFSDAPEGTVTGFPFSTLNGGVVRIHGVHHADHQS